MEARGLTLDLGLISPQAKQHLISCLNRKATPRPIWFSARKRSRIPRLALTVGAIAIGLALVFGAVLPGGVTGTLLWVVIAAPLVLGLASEIRDRRMMQRLPVEEGEYLFATDLVAVRDGACRLWNLDQLQGVKFAPSTSPRRDASAFEVQLLFGRERTTMQIDDRTTAQMVVENFTTARTAYIDALNAMDWSAVQTIDPLFAARYHERVDTALQPATAPAEDWLGFASPVFRWGGIAAVIVGGILAFASSFLQDQLAFSRARSVGTVQAWKNYLARHDARRRSEVLAHHLPAAAFEVARQAQTTAALVELLSRYSNSKVASEAEALLRARFDSARSNIRAKTTSETREHLFQLLKWVEAHPGRPAEIRFNPSSVMYLKGFDSFVDDLQQILRARGERLDIAPISPSINEKEIEQREAEIVTFVQQGFESLLGDLVTFRRGGEFSGHATGFNVPTFAVLAVAEPQPNYHLDLGSEKIYLDLEFKFELTLTVPGGEELQLSFQHVPTRAMPPKFFPRDLPDEYTKRPLYDLMVALAYQEMQTRTAAFFFPGQAPQPRLALPKFDATPEVPVRRAGPRTSATGFCVSPDGFVVTAQHFTGGAKSFRVKVDGQPAIEADLVAQDEEHDLAILKARAPIPALSLRPSSEVKLGSAVATIGFPNTAVQGQQPKVGRGEVSSLAGIRDDPVLFQISVPVQPGNSGGPLLDLHGNVIGVINSRLAAPGAQNVNYAVKSEYVLKLLERAKVSAASLAAPVETTPSFEDMIATTLRATVLLEGY